jgi:hypothetical protein
MFGRTYFHDTMRKYVILFGTLFNDVWINREDSQGNVKDVLKIPLTYGPRDKHLARIQGLNDGYDAQQQQFAMVVPRMGFEITGFNYAPERKLSTINKYTIEDIDGNKDKRYYQYMPVPYDITFNLSVFVKNSVDGTRIVEQIVPYFTPEWTSTVQLIEEPDITLDVPLILNAVSLDESYEGGFEDRRVQIWNLDFTMKCQLFGPIYQQKIIKLANTQIFDSSSFDDLFDSINQLDPAAKLIIQPGLLANNEPTIYTSLNTTAASGVAVITDGGVAQIQLTESGVGYSGAVIEITGGGGSGATAVAVFEDGIDSISSIEITNPGSGYTSTPTVDITVPDLISVGKNEIASEDNYGIAQTSQSPYPTE